ncbi:hypothetical protein ACQY0O_007508 [Thecaphora frezii]
MGTGSSRQATGTGSSRRATNRGNLDDNVTHQMQPLQGNHRRAKKKHYPFGGQDPQQNPLVLFIGSYKVGSQELKAPALEEFKRRMLLVYEDRFDGIDRLQFKPPAKIDIWTHKIDNGKEIEGMRMHLDWLFSRGSEKKRKELASKDVPLGTITKLDIEMAKDYEDQGYRIVFDQYPDTKDDNFVKFSVIARKDDDRNHEKVWVGDIAVPRSIL